MVTLVLFNSYSKNAVFQKHPCFQFLKAWSQAKSQPFNVLPPQPSRLRLHLGHTHAQDGPRRRQPSRRFHGAEGLGCAERILQVSGEGIDGRRSARQTGNTDFLFCHLNRPMLGPFSHCSSQGWFLLRALCTWLDVFFCDLVYWTPVAEEMVRIRVSLGQDHYKVPLLSSSESTVIVSM